MFKTLKFGFQSLKKLFRKSGTNFFAKIKNIFSKPLDQDQIEILEKTLYEADLGTSCVEYFMQAIKDYHKEHPQATSEDYIDLMKKKALDILQTQKEEKKVLTKPQVILVVGINGSGKTTTIAKLAKLYKDQRLKVLIVGGDTFRAAAKEQLAHWTDKIGVSIVSGEPKQDPASLLYDAIAKAQSQDFDIVICDTAGRLESKSNLLQEMTKISRVAKKQDPEAPHEVLMTVDATLGNTAIDQVKVFHEVLPLTGLILTKMDSTSKGGSVLALYRELQIPIQYIGFGETLDGIGSFDAESYVDALFSL